MGFQETKLDKLELPEGASLFKQTYEKTPFPDGVVVVKLGVFPDDQGGWFKEALRVNEAGAVEALVDQGTEFKIRQSNLSYIGAGAKRFWHVHPEQNEIWTTNATLLLGLIDLRKGSKTYMAKTKVVLSQDRAVYIPAGVAHGLLNPNNHPVTLVYYTDKHFSADEETQEYRIDPQDLPYDFVEPEVM